MMNRIRRAWAALTGPDPTAELTAQLDALREDRDTWRACALDAVPWATQQRAARILGAGLRAQIAAGPDVARRREDAE